VGLDKYKVPTKYVGLIKDMYNNVVTSVRTSNGDIDDFSIRMITSRVSFEPLRFCLGDG
jgi:phage gp37-like protein